jgi:hypothetical protein
MLFHQLQRLVVVRCADCQRAASGHAIALLPGSVMSLRRFIR